MPPDIQLLQSLENDCGWVSENYDKLQKYQGKVVAVKERNIIAVEENMDMLLQKLEKLKENPAFLLIEAIPRRNVALIL